MAANFGLIDKPSEVDVRALVKLFAQSMSNTLLGKV
jgi:hypothetical protein